MKSRMYLRLFNEGLFAVVVPKSVGVDRFFSEVDSILIDTEDDGSKMR